MTEQDVNIARVLNQDTVADSAERVEKGVARAEAQVALSDGVTFLFARMWTVLAVIVAPLFALLAKSIHGKTDESTDRPT